MDESEAKCETLDKDSSCNESTPGTIVAPGNLPSGGGGGFTLVTELPATGKKGIEYLLVDNTANPTEYYGGFYYQGEWLQVSTPTDQLVDKVTELPEEGKEGVLYYLEKEDEEDTYDLYRYINGEWVKVDNDYKLYDELGDHEDGSMTQKAVTEAIEKAEAKIPTTYWGQKVNSRGAVTKELTFNFESGTVGILLGRMESRSTEQFHMMVHALTGDETYLLFSVRGSEISSYFAIRPNDICLSTNSNGVPNDSVTRGIKRVTDPVDAQDAATKNYVDNLVPQTISNEDWSALWR